MQSSRKYININDFICEYINVPLKTPMIFTLMPKFICARAFALWDNVKGGRILMCGTRGRVREGENISIQMNKNKKCMYNYLGKLI